MKASIRKALLLDAFYQVLDNKIFRFLLFLVLGIVLASFVVGFREDRIELLFGWRSVSYDDVLRSFGMPGRIDDAQEKIVEQVQALLTWFLGGMLGMVFCLSATAFFVPRMLEKGSADIVFSKPVSRLRLLLSRYFAGLLFVGILATILVVGVYLGLTVTSGYSDTTFLWNAVTLVYLYGLLHSVSVLVGVVTRSTVATILVAICFFGGTGCVHQIWQARSYARDTELSERMRELSDEERVEDDDAGDDLPGFVRVLLTSLDVAHYVLPKTSDAPYVSERLRGAITEPALELSDEEGKLSIGGLSGSFRRVDDVSATEVDLDEQTVAWSVDGDAARIELRRVTRIEDDADRGPRRRSMASMARDMADELAERSSIPPTRDATAVDNVSAMKIGWAEDGAPRRTVLIGFGDWLYVVDLAVADGGDEGRAERRLDEFLRRFSIARDDAIGVDLPTWYDSRFDWTAPLPYNTFFSIGSSVAFALLMLALAWWRLSRIDF